MHMRFTQVNLKMENFCKILILFFIFIVDVNSKPSINCQKCLNDSVNYIDHYKYLQCKPIMSKDCPQCIESFDCPSLPLLSHELDLKKCHVSNLTYAVGELIDFKKQFCKYCNCVVNLKDSVEPIEFDDDSEDEDDTEKNLNTTALLFNPSNLKNIIKTSDKPKLNESNYEAKVTCAAYNSYRNYHVNPPNKNEYCFLVENECSAIKQCISPEKLEKENCQYQGKKYAYGEVIYPEEEDNCLKCKCNANWTSNKNQMIKQCERLSCELEDNLLYQGCIPIYENKCCPNNYYCSQEKLPNEVESVKPNHCYFHGKNYPIKNKLETDNSCLNCECIIPPYFTCKTDNKCES